MRSSKLTKRWLPGFGYSYAYTHAHTHTHARGQGRIFVQLPGGGMPNTDDPAGHDGGCKGTQLSCRIRVTRLVRQAWRVIACACVLMIVNLSPGVAVVYPSLQRQLRCDLSDGKVASPSVSDSTTISSLDSRVCHATSSHLPEWLCHQLGVGCALGKAALALN